MSYGYTKHTTKTENRKDAKGGVMAIQRCPHCNARLEVALFSRENNRPNGKSKPGLFESVALGQPPAHYGRLRSLFWFFKKENIYNPARLQERIIVRSEHKPTPLETLCEQLEFPVKVGEIRELARVYSPQPEGLGYDWSKANTVNNTSLGGGKHDNVKDAMVKLGFLKPLDAKHYELTPPGLRFLRHYLGEN